jgi:hypothetical protein
MSIPLSNVSKVNFFSQYSIDKICGNTVGSYNAADYTTQVGGGAFNTLYVYNIPHNFTRPVVVDMLVSLDNINFLPQEFSLSNGQFLLAYSDSSNIYIINSDNSSTIYYYWMVFTWIDNYDNSNPLIRPVFEAVQDNTSQTTFDSRQNYQKILSNTMQTYSSATTSATISHNLDYTPNFKIYFNSLSGQVWPNIGNSTNSGFVYSGSQSLVDGYVDDTNLYLDIYIPSGSINVWPRIYYDS